MYLGILWALVNFRNSLCICLCFSRRVSCDKGDEEGESGKDGVMESDDAYYVVNVVCDIYCLSSITAGVMVLLLSHC